MELAVRPARPEDPCVPLLYASAQPYYDAYAGGERRALALLRAVFPRAGHAASYELCQVAVAGEEVVGLLAGFIYVMIVSISELSSSILLYSPGTEVVSIMIWELWQNGQYVELSALGVMLIVALFVLVLLAQLIGKRFGIAEA